MSKFTDDIKKWSMIGGLVGIISIALSWIFASFKIPETIVTFAMEVPVRQQLQLGIPTKAGDMVLSYLGGIIPYTIPGAIAVLISGIAITVFGFLVVSLIRKLGVPTLKKPLLNLSLVLLVGSILVGLVLSGISFANIPAVGTIIAVAIYSLIAGLIIVGIEKIGLVKIPQI